MNNVYLYSATLYIFAVVLIVTTLNIIQFIKMKKTKKEIELLEKEKNTIIDAPIIIELSKAQNLVKNETLKEKVKIWQQTIDEIKKQNLNEINELILETDYFAEQKDYKNFKYKKIKTELKIYEAKEIKNKIFEQIKEITLCEDKNRSVIANLKIRFRQILTDFETVKIDLKDLEETVRLQIENIEKRFKDFETLLENQEYDEVNIIVSSIEKMINHMETILRELPSCVLMIKNIIPKRIEETNIMYKKLLKDEYQLDYLNVEYNIKEIEKKLSNSSSKIRVLNLEDVLIELKTILEYFDSLFSDFEAEKQSRKKFEEKTVVFKSKYEKLQIHMNKLHGKVEDAKYNYELNKEQTEILKALNEDLIKLNKDFEVLFETIKTVSFPYSKLLIEIETLISRLLILEDELEKYSEKVGSMQEDEKRAKEELEQILEIFKSSKYKIREYKLPIIPKNYYIELQDAIDSIKEVKKELEKKPINIEILNIRVDNARDLVLKFSSNSNEIVKTAVMAENAIIYGNRYKYSKENIEENLKKSEFLFSKGEYKKSLELTLNAIDIIEPGIYKKLKEIYESNK